MRRAQAFPKKIGQPGRVVGGDPSSDERDHFLKCGTCGHLIDMRDLAEVLEHEGPHVAPVQS